LLAGGSRIWWLLLSRSREVLALLVADQLPEEERAPSSLGVGGRGNPRLVEGIIVLSIVIYLNTTEFPKAPVIIKVK